MQSALVNDHEKSLATLRKKVLVGFLVCIFRPRSCPRNAGTEPGFPAQFLLSHGKLNPFTESGCAVFSISHISRNYIVDLKFSRWLFLVVFETVFVQKQNYSFEDWLPLETTILNSTICVPIANLQHHLSQNITPQFAPSPTSR